MIAVIQAGGKGTRITSITEDKIPKPMIPIDDKPILYHQIMNLKRYNITEIIIIVSHLGNIIKEYFKDGHNLGLNISYIEESPENPLGTAGALYYLKDTIKDDFIFLLGDVFIDIDFDKFIKYHQNHHGDVTLLTHPNNHPFDSDLILTKDDLVIGIDYKDSTRTNYHNLVNAGVMIFSTHTLDYINDLGKYSYEKNIVFPLINEGKVYSYKTSEYVKDTGTPERYQQVLLDYQNNIPKKKNLSNKQKCIFLDRDGTINKYVGLLTNVNDLELLPNVSKAIKKINESGYLCIIITNQPAIARGDITFEYLDEIHKKLATLLGNDNAYIDDIFYCPHHPDKGYDGEVPELKIKCDCRKPNIGLIKEAANKYNIDLTKSFMIGDTTSDMECAKRAGLTSVYLTCGEKEHKYDVVPDYKFNSLSDAINEIIR